MSSSRRSTPPTCQSARNNSAEQVSATPRAAECNPRHPATWSRHMRRQNCSGNRVTISVVIGFALLTGAACANDAGRSPLTPTESSLSQLAPSMADEQVPTYSEERPGTFVDMPDEVLWEHISYSRNVAVIGLRKPGVNRGTYRGRILLDRAEWANAAHAVVAQRGVTLLLADTLLPTIKVRLDDIEVLRSVRKLPFVSYVEPIRARGDLGFRPSTCGSSGGSSGSAPDLWAGTGALYYTSNGDVYSDRHVATGVDKAWARGADGSGVNIGLVDTGVADLPYFYNEWTSGESSGRYLLHGRAMDGLISGPSGDIPCGHGTLMAGAIAAPKDGRNVVGIAYRANMVEVSHQWGDVWPVGADHAQHAVRVTAQALRARTGGKIMSMAWESQNWWWQVSDEINYWYYAIPDLLYFAAAGTGLPINEVTFPADQPNVVAVTCADYPSGSVSSRCSHGSQVQFMAYQWVPSYQYNNGGLSRLGGSSNATAVVVGIAALTWSRYPTWPRAAILDRLQRSGSLWPNRDSQVGYGVLNAHVAVGGFRRVDVRAPYRANPGEIITMTAEPMGDGPFTYLWDQGETTQSVSRMAGAEGTEVTASVTVTDVVDGTVKAGYGITRVEYHPCDPSQVICN